MNKGDLQKLTGLSSSIIAKLSKEDGRIMLDVVDRICKALNVPIYNVVEYSNKSQIETDNHASVGNGTDGEK